MAKKKVSSSTSLIHLKKHFLPSMAGGGMAYILSGVVVLGLAVFATVWIGNMLSHHLHKK